MNQRDNERNTIKSTLAFISAFLSILVAVMTLVLGAKIQSISLFGIELAVPTTTPTYITTTPIAVTPNPDVNSRIANLENEVKSLRQEINGLKQNTPSSNTSNANTASLQELDGRISVIEQAVLDNPSRALQLPMLSQEMDNMKASYEKDLQTTRQEVDRLYDLNKWFIGLMFTMALGIVSMSISNFMKKPETPSKPSSTRTKKDESQTKTG